MKRIDMKRFSELVGKIVNEHGEIQIDKLYVELCSKHDVCPSPSYYKYYLVKMAAEMADLEYDEVEKVLRKKPK
ncbi:MAG: hypothetical protein QW733_01995 [Desulfurococcaceae archaeon]|uniref:hypothetical protein n=1 Tax=Desulfurococcus sp. TaxID=51678 RepID=UPI003161C05A